MLAAIGAYRNVRLSSATGKAAARCNRIRPVVDFSVGENDNTEVLAKHNSVTNALPRKTGDWMADCRGKGRSIKDLQEEEQESLLLLVIPSPS